MTKTISRFLSRYWGYFALAVAVYGVFEHLAVPVVLTLAGAAFVYLLVQAPLWCRAPIRSGEPCRNNSHGLLLGCWIREHKWQRTKNLFLPSRWDAFAQGMLGSPKDFLATVSAVIAIGAFVAEGVRHL